MAIKSPKNRVLKDIRRLRRCKGDHALLEGPHLVGEALATGLHLETVLATPAAIERQHELVAGLERPPLEVTEEALDSVTESDSPRGLLALARLPRSGAETLPVEADGLYLYLDGLQDPGNLGAVARSAEAAGVSGIALSAGCAHPNHARALRASAGSLLRVPTAVEATVTTVRARLAPVAPAWAALSTAAETNLSDTQLDPPLVLVLGSERGLDEDLAQQCDIRLSIPMAAPVESLNAAVAAALVLFEIRRRQSSS